MTETVSLVGFHEPIILTVDNGASNTRIALGVESIKSALYYDTPKDYDRAVDELSIAARWLLDGKRPDAIGFGIAGAVEDGQIVSAGKLQEYGWCQRPFAGDVAESLGILAERVVLLNDCAAGANAERIARGVRDGEAGVFATLSTGFGAGLYNVGESGTDLMNPEPGHDYFKGDELCSCGMPGHIEAYIGGSGIERNYGQRGENIPHDDSRWLTIKSDFHEAMAELLERWEDDLGVNPRIIGFTGSVALGGPDMLGGLQLDLRERLRDRSPAIEVAVYGDRSDLYGAAFAAQALLAA